MERQEDFNALEKQRKYFRRYKLITLSFMILAGVACLLLAYGYVATRGELVYTQVRYDELYNISMELYESNNRLISDYNNTLNTLNYEIMPRYSEAVDELDICREDRQYLYEYFLLSKNYTLSNFIDDRQKYVDNGYISMK